MVRRIRSIKPKPLILLYHRIADEPIDPWEIVVSPGNFEQQLQVVRRTRQPFELTGFMRKLMAGTLPANAVTLTFDDGYVDNLIAGKPRLAAADVPATVFIATGYIDRSEGFWWDELAKLVLLTNRPRSFELLIRGEITHFNFGTETIQRGDGNTFTASFRNRHAVLRQIWQTLRMLDEDERRSAMLKIRPILGGRDHHTTSGRAMTREEVRALVADGLIGIGAHTVTHPVLTGLPATTCHREIAESKLTCEGLLGTPVTAFAYPFGEFDAQAREAVKTAGFTIACSVQHGPTRTTSDIFALPRIHVRNSGRG